MLGLYLLIEIHSKFERTIKLNNLQINEKFSQKVHLFKENIFQNHQAPGFRAPTWQKLLFFFL